MATIDRKRVEFKGSRLSGCESCEEKDKNLARLGAELKKYAKAYADKCQENAQHIGLLQEAGIFYKSEYNNKGGD